MVASCCCVDKTGRKGMALVFESFRKVLLATGLENLDTFAGKYCQFMDVISSWTC